MEIVQATEKGKEMIVIGKVQEIYRDSSLPAIKENVLKLDQATKDVVLKYLKKGKVTSSAPSTARDVLTGEKLGFSLTMQSDGEYAWRSDTVYYFEKYDLNLGNEFIGHVMNKTKH